ncbi:MAG TPA: Wzy polymerase domain-containing protein [Burkholderiales bacterium]|nr:Wzy polymerase domain-containing protein [Burkholderiales bacterium]
MNVAENTRGPHEIGLLLAGAMCALPFLVPYHQLPILSFYPEWLAAALGVSAALCVLAWRGGAVDPLPAPSLWLVVLALYFLARAFMGQPYPQIGALAACYVVFAALMVWLGAQLASGLGAERVCTVLSVALLAGALANALAGTIQFYGRPALLEDVVADLAGRRAYGNIAQANLYANYIALGQCALIFLWLRRQVPTLAALPIAVFLAAAGALSGSRIAILFAGWIALFGVFSGRLVFGGDIRRLTLGAFAVAGCAVAMHFAVPWINESLGLHRAGESALDRMSAFAAGEPRREIYSLGFRVFVSAPVFGVGLGAFPGAAFDVGLDPSLTRSGEVLSSPHNLLLHLLAESGVLGAALCLGALCVWGWQLARRLSDARPALWWSLAVVGVELLHSMLEFPFWSADFLAVAALAMGVGLAPASSSGPMATAMRAACLGGCAALVLALVVLLGDYVRLDATRITGSAVTLSSAADAKRDAATLRAVARGLLAPVAEQWIVQSAPLDRRDLGEMLERSGRVATFWPSNAVITHRAAFLELDGRAEEARALRERAARTFRRVR